MNQILLFFKNERKKRRRKWLNWCWNSYSICWLFCSSSTLFDVVRCSTGEIVLGIESFHVTSPNWISNGSDANWTVGCIDTGWGGMDDGKGRFVVDGNEIFLDEGFSNDNVCVAFSKNSNWSVVDSISSPPVLVATAAAAAATTTVVPVVVGTDVSDNAGERPGKRCWDEFPRRGTKEREVVGRVRRNESPLERVSFEGLTVGVESFFFVLDFAVCHPLS